MIDFLLKNWLPRQILKLVGYVAGVIGITDPGWIDKTTGVIIIAVTALVEMLLSRASHNKASIRRMAFERGLLKAAELGRNPLVALVWLLPALFLTGCGLTETGTAPKGVSFDLVSGVCYTTADGKFRGCYNPLSRTVTVVRTGVTGSAALVYDAGTKVWRGTAPDGTSVVWDQVHGLRTEPALPVVSSK